MLEDEILTLNDIDNLDGLEFENISAIILNKLGYNVSITKASGDFGADIIAKKDGISYAIQCKRFSTEVNLKAVQEVHSAKAFYNCDYGVVLTNNHFNKSAKELALKTNTLLWDRSTLFDLLHQYNKIIYDKYTTKTPTVKTSHISSYKKLNKKNNKWITLIFLIFFGFFGIHKFYERKIFQGLFYIITLISPISPLIILFCIIDFILILKQKNPYYT